MTIYVPGLRELPRDQMAELDGAAEFSVRHTGGKLSAYVYEWEDLRIVIDVMPDADRAGHLKQFERWIEVRSASLGQVVEPGLVDRIRSSTIVLGIVVEKTTDRDVWHDRVQDIVGMICFNTKSLLFWEGMVYNENCRRVWPAGK